MKIFLACLFTAIYVLIAVRVAFVSWRIETNSGRQAYAVAVASGVLWPLMAVTIGFGTIISGDPGIYAPNWKYNPDPPGGNS